MREIVNLTPSLRAVTSLGSARCAMYSDSLSGYLYAAYPGGEVP